jgi:putative transcriptional regulator
VESLAGKLLVSSPVLFDPNFRRTVVLIAHHDEEGAMGVILTRPTDVRVAEVHAELAELPAGEIIYSGGPVQPDTLIVLLEFADTDDAETPIVGTVAFLPPDLPLEDARASRARVFAGYAGWGAGQLEAEMEEQSWIVVPAEPDDVFADDPDELWRTVLHRKGGKFSLIASMPFDPGLN